MYTLLTPLSEHSVIPRSPDWLDSLVYLNQLYTLKRFAQNLVTMHFGKHRVIIELRNSAFLYHEVLGSTHGTGGCREDNTHHLNW